jgi:hypothetical protein
MTAEERQRFTEQLIVDLAKMPLPEDAVASIDRRLLRTYFDQLVARIRSFNPDASDRHS